MKEKDELKQNKGAQQGNIHQDSDEGKNESGKAGSTLDKTENNKKASVDDTESEDSTGSTAS